MATKDSKTYWRNRADERLVYSEQIANVANVRIAKLYEQAIRNIDRQIKSVYDNYSVKGVLDVSELQKALNPNEKAIFLANVERQAKILGLDPKKIYDKRYLWRLNRLEAIKEQIRLEVMSTAPREEAISKRAYSSVAKESYKNMQSDFAKQGITPAFSTLDTETTEAILKSRWYGGNYSTRIWGNTSKLAIQLPTILGGALSSGESYQTTSRTLRDRFGVRLYEATRLVRTEGNYIHGQAELQSYVDDGIEEYEYHAEMDERTSTICRSLNRKRYKVSEAVVGENFPPMHGNCRSTTVAILRTDKEGVRKQKIAREDRLARFKGDFVLDNDLERRFKKAMQDQMNPNKAVHDYNADLNIITKSFKGEELAREIAKFMDTVPEDHPLRGGFETIAKLHGWENNAVSKDTATVKKIFEQADLDLEDIHLTDEQKNFIAKSGVKFDGSLAEGDITNMGTFNADSNTVSLSGSRLKYYEKMGAKDFYNTTFQHELGHAIDHNARLFGVDSPRFSYNDKFSPLVWNEDGFTNEAYSISKYRVSRGLVDKDVKSYFDKLSVDDYKQGLLSGGEFKVKGEVHSIPASLRDYHLENPELFAEAYSIYNTNPRYLKTNAPKMFDYLNYVSSLTI